MAARRGDDLRFDLKLNFFKAILGGEEKIEICHLETCQICNGCGEQKRGLGDWLRGEPLATCNNCNGSGRIEVPKSLTIMIPAGVEEGTRLRVSEEGDAGERGGATGDLYIYLSVGQDSELKRDGINLLSEVMISEEQAASGCQIQVRTIDGIIDINVPPLARRDAVLELHNRGVPVLGNPKQRGDHLISIKVELNAKSHLLPLETSLEEVTENHIDYNAHYKRLFFVDQSIEELVIEYNSRDTLLNEPFNYLRDGNLEAAKKSLRQLLDNPTAEIRHKLWTWKALRQLGELPSSSIGDEVQGVVLEVPLDNWVDTLAVYSDGRVRYLNGKIGMNGGLIMFEDTENPHIKPLAMRVIDSAKSLVGKTPIVDKHDEENPTVEPRISVLTHKGIYIIDRDCDNSYLTEPVLSMGTQLFLTLLEVNEQSKRQ